MNSTTFAALVSVAADYFFIALQAPERRKEAIDRFLADQARSKSSVELEAGCVYAGKRKVGERGVRGNVALFATVGTAEEMRECRDYVANHADLLRGGGSLGAMEATNAYVWAKRMKSFGCAWSRRGADNMALVLCRVCANRPLVAPPKDALFTAAEKAREAASLAKRGAEAAAQLTVGKGWEPPQLPKSLTKNAAIPLCCRI